MKAYIQSELVGDEDVTWIDCAFIQCELHDRIFKALTDSPAKDIDVEMLDGVIRAVLTPYCVSVPLIDINFTFKR